MDLSSSPPTASSKASPRLSLINGSTTTASAIAPLVRVRSQRSVKFDPTISSSVGGPPHSNELSLDTSFIHGAGGDADTHEHRGGRGRGVDAMLDFRSSSNESMHDHEDLLHFQLTRDDVEAAFQFLDVNGSGLLTMGNLKQRLSAFFPQLTTKEYKFLVEDPSGSTGGCGAASGAVRTCSAARHGGIGAARSGSSGGEAAPIDGAFSGEGGTSGAGGSYTNGTRAGLNIDQLWDLINSFQQLQRSLGGGQVGPTEGHSTPSSGAAPTTAFNTSLDPYLVGSQGNVGARAGEGGFDAVAEAFRIYDPRNSHYVDEEILSCIMARVGFGDLSKEELAVLVSTADFDGDGRISLEDFRHLVCMKGRFKK